MRTSHFRLLSSIGPVPRTPQSAATARVSTWIVRVDGSRGRRYQIFTTREVMLITLRTLNIQVFEKGLAPSPHRCERPHTISHTRAIAERSKTRFLYDKSTRTNHQMGCKGCPRLASGLITRLRCQKRRAKARAPQIESPIRQPE